MATGGAYAYGRSAGHLRSACYHAGATGSWLRHHRHYPISPRASSSHRVVAYGAVPRKRKVADPWRNHVLWPVTIPFCYASRTKPRRAKRRRGVPTVSSPSCPPPPRPRRSLPPRHTYKSTGRRGTGDGGGGGSQLLTAAAAARAQDDTRHSPAVLPAQNQARNQRRLQYNGRRTADMSCSPICPPPRRRRWYPVSLRLVTGGEILLRDLALCDLPSWTLPSGKGGGLSVGTCWGRTTGSSLHQSDEVLNGVKRYREVRPLSNG